MLPEIYQWNNAMKTRVQEFSWGNWNFQVEKWFAEEKKKKSSNSTWLSSFLIIFKINFHKKTEIIAL